MLLLLLLLQLATAHRLPAACHQPRPASCHVRVLPPAGNELHPVQPTAVRVAELALQEGDPRHDAELLLQLLRAEQGAPLQDHVQR